MQCATHFRSLCLLTLLFLALGTSYSTAQRRFPSRLDLDSRLIDTLRTPDATSARHRYRVTAWGTYSMWEDTVNSSVDPVWIYSFPQEEWDKPEWRIFPEGYPIYVGDQRMLDAHGVRINNLPFPKLTYSATHRYSMIIQGDGRPISASIVDWNFKGFVKQDAHSNNTGWVHVLIEELPLTEWEICAIDSSAFPTIRLSVKVMRDSVRVEDFGDRLLLSENGMPVAINRVDCSERTSQVSVAMVFDRSGSMNEPFGNSTRIDYTKIAGKKFVDKLTASDEAAIYSFSLGTTLDQSWTNDKPALRGAIDRLYPDGWTAMNDAVLEAINDISRRPAGRSKAIVVLSDGEDNRSTVRDIQTVIDRARAVGVPVFAIGLLLDTDDSLRLLATRTGGRYYSVKDPASMDSVFASIADIVFEKGCCSVYYTSPDPRRNGSWRGVLPRFTYDDDTVAARPTGYTAPVGASSVDNRSGAAAANAIASIRSISPNPMGSSGSITFAMQRAGHLRLDVLDVGGREVALLFDGERSAGESSVAIRTDGFAPGTYFIRLTAGGVTSINVMIVTR